MNNLYMKIVGDPFNQAVNLIAVTASVDLAATAVYIREYLYYVMNIRYIQLRK